MKTVSCSAAKAAILSAFAVLTQTAFCAQRPVKPDTPDVIEWKQRMPAIQRLLDKDPQFHCPTPHSRADILDASGTASDGLSVALVDWCAGGAYTDWIVALRLKDGRPVLAEFRDDKGKPIPNGFAQGASVMHSVDVKLVPEKNAIYTSFWDNNSQGKLAQCSVKAYVWTAKSETFDFNERLSHITQSAYCSALTSLK